MSKTVNLGGDRLGSGNKMKVGLHGYRSSNVNLGYVFRNTQAPGTLVPFIVEYAQPADNFRIDLDSRILTHPTVGPLFGSFKVQYDVFVCPIRLYHSRLHNNPTEIGMQTETIKFPQLDFQGCNIINDKSEIPPELQQINPSSIFSYLGLNGFGSSETFFNRQFNALPFLSYWDIYKNYYADKQSKKGVVVHNDPHLRIGLISHYLIVMNNEEVLENVISPPRDEVAFGSPITIGDFCNTGGDNYFIIDGIEINNPEKILLSYNVSYAINNGGELTAQKQTNYKSLYKFAERRPNGWKFYGAINYFNAGANYTKYSVHLTDISCIDLHDNDTISLKSFDLSELDKMRKELLMYDPEDQFMINDYSPLPYSLPFKKWDGNEVDIDLRRFTCSQGQEGLAIKTYQSDLFNNILNTEWIDGDNGVNTITAVDVSSGLLKIDQLNIQNKIYNLLNRVVVSGNTLDDYIETVWDIEVTFNKETPTWVGGMSKELVFQEVVSNVGVDGAPLGSLAGKGQLLDSKKGGYINCKIYEPSFIIGIVSITPRIDYSQGNRFFVDFDNFNELHKPALDEIGFQSLLSDRMHAATTYVGPDGDVIYKEVGKSVAWIDYRTNYNRLHGNFADSRNEMFMTLARRYEIERVHPNHLDYKIKDMTTYIDPAKFNYIFAQTSRDAMNFWVQIGVNMNVRRKISSRLIPNL